MWRLAAAALLLSACSFDRSREIAGLLASAQDDLRRGELAKGTAASERGLALASGRDGVAEWKFRLLRCEMLLMSHAGAEVLPELRKPLPQAPEYAALAARQKMLEGQALLMTGQADRADGVLDAARQQAETTRDVPTLIQVQLLQGSRLLRKGQWTASEDVLRRALSEADASHLPYFQAGALVNLGMIRLSRYHYDEAAGYFQRAAQLAGPEMAPLYSVAQSNLGICYYQLGETDRAIQIQLQAIARHQRSGANLYLQRAFGEAGNAYILNGSPQVAARYLVQALQLAKQVGSNSDAAIWAGDLSSLYAELGDWGNADRFNQEAIRIKTSMGARTLVYNTLLSARIAIGRGQVSQAEQLYAGAIAVSQDNPSILWDAYGGLAQAAMLQGRWDVASRRFEDALHIVEQTRSDLLSTEYKLPFLSRLIRFYQSYVDALVARGDYDRALAVADSSRGQVLAERFGSGPARLLPASTFQKIAQETGSTIVTYWLGAQRSHAWVITRDRIRHVALPGEREIEPLVTEYSYAIERSLADPVRARIPAGERLFQMLVQPLELPAGSSVVLVPDGALTGFNFETLPVPGPKPHFWIEEVSIAVAPAISVLRHPPAQTAKARGLLLIGDAINADGGAPPLAHAALEIRNVTRHFEPLLETVLRGNDATPEAYGKAEPGNYGAIHFTAHATANRESPLESAVLLSKGKLYAREVMGLPLHAELVTVSACSGAGSRIYSGEGMVGFAWAFLRAGARNVIAGLWDVNDQSTAELMDSTYGQLESGLKPREALRAAKLAMIRSSTNFRKPYYWGPFQVYTVAP